MIAMTNTTKDDDKLITLTTRALVLLSKIMFAFSHF